MTQETGFFLIVIAGHLPEFAEALITAVVREESGDGVDIPADTRMYIESTFFKTKFQSKQRILSKQHLAALELCIYTAED